MKPLAEMTYEEREALRKRFARAVAELRAVMREAGFVEVDIETGGSPAIVIWTETTACGANADPGAAFDEAMAKKGGTR